MGLSGNWSTAGNSQPAPPLVTVTLAERLILPLLPLHANVKVLVVVSAPVLWLPDSSFVPDHAPEAVQKDTLVAVQESVAEPPLATTVGLAESVRVGVVAEVMVTLAVALALPPVPVHVSVNELLLVSEVTVVLPESDFAPDQAPEAAQPVAFEDDQLSVVEPPLGINAGEAMSETVGADREGDVVPPLTASLPLSPPPPQAVKIVAETMAKIRNKRRQRLRRPLLKPKQNTTIHTLPGSQPQLRFVRD